ncbi:MAG: DUF1566 domain-containing protein [bacterium]|nr:DUF1566 domain-containing protein [bacterium]
MLGLDDNWRPFEYLENDIKEVGEVLVDSATGLMWQKSGPISVSYQGAQAYVEELNRGRFADYDDWRLPTIAELLSLLEPEKQAHELYINPMVESKQYDRRWSSDNISADSAWFVDFYFGFVDWPDDFALVRAVRSL